MSLEAQQPHGNEGFKAPGPLFYGPDGLPYGQPFDGLAVGSNRIIEENPKGGMAAAVNLAIEGSIALSDVDILLPENNIVLPTVSSDQTQTTPMRDDAPIGNLRGFDTVKWIGWNGKKNEYTEEGGLEESLMTTSNGAQYERVGIPLDPDEYKNYYNGFCNEVLWPLSHGYVENVHFDHPDYWNTFKAVDNKFADTIIDKTSPNTLVWMQDYHMPLVAKSMHEREVPVERPLAFFWHIPFADPDTFGKLPEVQRTELLEGFLHYNLVGFHTEEYVDNFLRTVQEFLPEADIQVTPDGTKVEYKGRTAYVAAFPIGIDGDVLRTKAQSPATQEIASNVRSEYKLGEDQKMIFNAARRDYMKGFVEGLDILKVAFEKYPDLTEQVVYVQGDQPSRPGIHEYDELDGLIKPRVIDINKLGTPSWQPVFRNDQGFNTPNMHARLMQADVLFITSIIDGFNLVIPEFFELNERNGAVVASEKVGAVTIYENAVTPVFIPEYHNPDPYKYEPAADGLYKAVTMPEQERIARMQEGRRISGSNNVHVWAQRQWDFMAKIKTGQIG